MISGVNIINGKTSTASVNGAMGFVGCSELLNGGFRGHSPLRKLLGSKEHLDWLKIDLKAAEIVTLQDL